MALSPQGRKAAITLLVCAAIASSSRASEPAPGPAGVAIFGEVLDSGADHLTIRQIDFLAKYANPDGETAAGASPSFGRYGSQLRIDLTSRTMFRNGSGRPNVGETIFVGAALVDGALTASVVASVKESGWQIPAVIEPRSVKTWATPAAHASNAGGEQPIPNDSCRPYPTFSPTPDTLNFAGCFGYPSYSAAVDIGDVLIFAYPPGTTGFQMFLQRVDINASTAGYQFELPFRFSAVDVKAEEVQQWVNQCTADYGTVDGCPYPRPAVPPVGASREVRLNVTPVDPSPSATFQGGSGFNVRARFRFHTDFGCGIAGASPCEWIDSADFGAMSNIARAQGAPPAAGHNLPVPAVQCAGSGLLGPYDSFIVNPLSFEFCYPYQLDGTPFTTSITSENAAIENFLGTGVTQPLTFDLTQPQSVWIRPGSLNGVKLRFSHFNYVPNIHEYFQFRLSSLRIKYAQTNPVQINYGSFPMITDPYPAPNSGFGGVQPAFIDVPVELAPSGTWFLDTKTQNTLVPLPASGGKLRLIGGGFSPFVQANGSVLPGSGITAVYMEGQPVPFSVDSNTQLTLTVPPHAPTVQKDANGNLNITTVRIDVRGWGETRSWQKLLYALPPSITLVTPAQDAAAGGERVRVHVDGSQAELYHALDGISQAWIGNTPVLFTLCGNPSAFLNAACQFTQYYDDYFFVAIAPPGPAGVAPVRFYKECSPFAIGRADLVCGMSAASPAAQYRYLAPPPPVASLSPFAGPSTGGTSVTLTGSGLLGVTSVNFGASQTTSLIVNSDTRLTVTTPGSALSAVPVTVSIPCNSSPFGPSVGIYCSTSDPGATFTYLPAPTVTSLTPASGPILNLSSIVVDGTRLSTTSSVKVGGVPAAFSIVSATRLLVTVPARDTEGDVDLVVTTACGTPATASATSCGPSAATAASRFTYVVPPGGLLTRMTTSPAQAIDGVVAMQAVLVSSTGVPLAGKAIAFTVNGKDGGIAITDSNGIAQRAPMIGGIASGFYEGGIAARFTGDQTLAASAASASLFVRRSSVVAWGYNGQLQSDVPSGLDDVTAIASGPDFSLALKKNGTVVGWGQNNCGQASPPPGLDNVAVLAAGDNESYAVKNDGSLVGWGCGLWGGGGSFAFPADWGWTDLVAVASARSTGHVLGLKRDGTLISAASEGSYLDPPAGLTDVVAIAGGTQYYVALRANGTMVAWGYPPMVNSNGLVIPVIPPDFPTALQGVRSISIGRRVGLAVKTDGRVTMWGDFAAVPNGPPFTTMSGVVAAAAGVSHIVTLQSDGTVKAHAFGSPGNGQLNVPVDLSNVLQIAAGDYHSVALMPLARLPIGPITLEGVNFSDEAGGTPVYFSGSDLNRVSEVRFGATPVPFTYLGAHVPQLIGVIAPAHAAGVVNVSVIVPCAGDALPCGESPATPSSEFHYLGVPMVTALAPSSAATNVVTHVRITGTGFRRTRAVTLGGEGASFTIVSDTELETVFNPHAAGSFDVRVTTECRPAFVTDPTSCGDSAAHSGSRFTFIAPSTPLTVSVGRAVLGAPVALTATLQPNPSQGPANGKLISFSINGSPAGTAVTDAAGVAKLQASIAGIAGGKYPNAVVASFAGDASYGAASATADLTVARSPVVAWGVNNKGQTDVPADLTNVVAVSAGFEYSLALLADGTVRGWGSNIYGKATPPASLTDAVAISAGLDVSYALRRDGTVVAWGAVGQLPPGLTGVSAIAQWNNRLVALKTDGSMVLWTVSGFEPFGTDAPVSKVAFDSHGFIALKRDGGIVWSLSGFGGGLASGDDYIPAGPQGEEFANEGFIAVAVSSSIDLFAALKADGTLIAWTNAWNPAGQYQARVIATDISAVSLAEFHGLLLDRSGQVSLYPIPVIDLAELLDPLQVPAGLKDVSAISAHSSFVFNSETFISDLIGHNLAIRSGSVDTSLTLVVRRRLNGEIASARATLRSGAVPLAGQTIAFSRDGVSLGVVTTDALGEARIEGIPIPDDQGGPPNVLFGARFDATPEYGSSSATAGLTIAPDEQSITFGNLAARTFGDAPFDVTATATSGLPVSFSAFGACTIAGGTITLTGAGTCDVLATQNGDADFLPAASVMRGFSISRAVPVIAWTTPADITHGTALDATQLKASSVAAIPGAFGYVPAAGTVLGAGAGQVLSVIFLPDNTFNYEVASATTTINVRKAAQYLLLFGLQDRRFGDPPFTVEAFITGPPSGNRVTYVATGTCSVSGNVVTITGSGYCTVTASLAGNANYFAAADESATFAIAGAGQTITFDALPDRTFGDAAFTVAATGGNSGNAVTFAATGDCTVAADLVTITGAGSCTVTASQAGNANYLAAADVSRSFAIANAALASQTITFDAVTDKIFGDAPFAVTATGGGSGNAVTFAATGACNVAAAFVTITGAGSCTVTASQAGNANYAAAADVARSFTIAMASQMITFDALTDKTYGAEPFTVAASGGNSGNAVTFAATGTCSVAANLVTIAGAGSCTVTASQAGNANYLAAADVSRTFAIAGASQTITFDALSDKTYGDAPFTVAASGGNSGNAVTFAATGNCTVTADLVTITGAGSCTVTASQAGNANYLAAADVSRSFAIANAALASQTITFEALSDKTYGDAAFTVSATGGGSGNAVTFAATGACNITADLVSITGAGSCSVTASQAGNTNYAAAADVSRTFAIAPAGQTITFATLSNKTFGDAPFTLAATGGNSGNMVTFAATGACNAAANLVTITGTGSCTVTASQQGNSNYLAAADVSRTFAIGVASQTITFDALSGKTYGDAAFTVSASGGGSGNAVTFASTGACHVAADLVTITGAGSCTVTASQAGNANYLAAADVSRTFAISLASQTITFDGLSNKIYGDAPFMVSATGGASGNGVMFAATGQCGVAGDLVSITGAGSCTVTASQTGNANYSAAADVSRTFAISKASSTTTVTINGGPFVFRGAAVTPATVSVTGVGLALTPDADYANNVNAGTASASYDFAGDANHEPSSDSESFAIGKAASTTTVTINGGPFVYTGAAETPATVSVTGVGLSLTPTANYANNVNAGTASASYDFAGDANHEPSSDSASFAIGKAASTTTVTINGGPFVYTGAAQTPATVTVTGIGLSLTPAADYTNNINAGTASASYGFAGDANHEPSSDSASFAIAKAMPTLTVVGGTFAYDGSSHPATGSVTGVGGVNLGAPGFTYNGSTQTPISPGTYAVIGSFAGSANYLPASGTATIVINQTSTLTVTATADKTSLWPPNGKLVPVTVKGRVTGGVSATYRVIDEYSLTQPGGAVTLNGDGSYAFTVMLPADRKGSDNDGRTFTIRVTATDSHGNSASATVVVVAPHDQGK